MAFFFLDWLGNHHNSNNNKTEIWDLPDLRAVRFRFNWFSSIMIGEMFLLVVRVLTTPLRTQWLKITTMYYYSWQVNTSGGRVPSSGLTHVPVVCWRVGRDWLAQDGHGWDDSAWLRVVSHPPAGQPGCGRRQWQGAVEAGSLLRPGVWTGTYSLWSPSICGSKSKFKRRGNWSLPLGGRSYELPSDAGGKELGPYWHPWRKLEYAWLTWRTPYFGGRGE